MQRASSGGLCGPLLAAHPFRGRFAPVFGGEKE
jgi:hypothetical protein